MIQECLEVFQEQLNKKGERFILDTYTPTNGTYILVDKQGEVKEILQIKMNKQKREIEGRGNEYFPDICFYDYYSQLISTQKKMDEDRKIHSNNYLSFWVKKENIQSGKLTEKNIDAYYNNLKDPVKYKYKNKATTEIYLEFTQKEGSPPEEEIEKNRQWIKKNIFCLDTNYNIDMQEKEYVKIFFEADKEEYRREGQRYILPNIYNSNNYNITIENKIYGLPGNNVNMNNNKPFLSIKTRKTPASYLIDREAVMLQKQFFDYLTNQVSRGNYHIYVDTTEKKINSYSTSKASSEIKTGYYLRLKKGKTETEILVQDNISGYKPMLPEDKQFDFIDILEEEFKFHEEYKEKYGPYKKMSEIGGLVHEIFFSKCLSNNYMTEVKDIKINDSVIKQAVVLYRDAIFRWIYEGQAQGIPEILDKLSFQLIKNSVLNGYKEKAVWQFNLRLSFQNYFLRGEKNMAEIISNMREKLKEKILSEVEIFPESDEEYYYVVGQAAAFLISLNKSKDKKQMLINPILNAKTDEILKEKIIQLYKKYNYAIPENSRRVKNILAMICGYIPEKKVNEEMILLGYVCSNMIYIKEEKN